MHPVLFTLFGFKVGTYGVLIAAAVILGLLWLRRLAKRAGVDPEPLTDLVVGATIAALIGAKLLLILTDWNDFAAAPLDWAKSNLRAFGVYYGGFIAAVLYIFWACWRKKIGFWMTVDLMAPPLALGHAIGRWGCFAAGCCFGHATHVPWAVTFRDPASLINSELIDVPVHPVQLYESAGNFLLALLLAAGLRKKWPAGRVFILYLLLYGISRFIYEIFRGDERGTVFGGMLSTSQFLAILTVAVAAALFVYRRKAQIHEAKDA
jgi:phosphatidylglycerol:prolipoprotein diacylglycerol transferase